MKTFVWYLIQFLKYLSILLSLPLAIVFFLLFLSVQLGYSIDRLLGVTKYTFNTIYDENSQPRN